MVTAGKRASGVAAQPARKRLTLGALRRCTPKGLAKIGEVGEALDRQINELLRPRPDMQTRLPRRVFALWVSLSRSSAKCRAGLRVQREPAPSFRKGQLAGHNACAK